MAQALILGFLTLLGIAAYYLSSMIWRRFKLASILAEDVYGQAPVSTMGFIFNTFLSMGAILSVASPFLFALFLISLVWNISRVIERSSAEIGFKILRYALALAFVVVFTFVGVIAAFIAIIMNREARQQAINDQIRQLQIERANSEMHRPF